MTLGHLMRLVMRLQSDTRTLAEALDEYDGWRDIPGQNAAYCADVVDALGFELEMLRDTLRDEHTAIQTAQAKREARP